MHVLRTRNPKLMDYVYIRNLETWIQEALYAHALQKGRSRLPSMDTPHKKRILSWRNGGLNPGPFTCKANALPLSYTPVGIPMIKRTTFYKIIITKTNLLSI
jgi:hypothetical protein